MVVADKNKRLFKNKKFEDIENMQCLWHPFGNHTTRDCCIFIERYPRKYPRKNSKLEKKGDDQKKEEDNQNNQGDKRNLGSRSKHQDKLALWTIMAAEPATSIGLNIQSS